MRRYFILTTKKCRIYAACGVSQTPKHFKEVEGGHEKISEIVEKYGDERAMKAKIVSTQNLMKNMKLTLEQALNVLEIQGDEWAVITKQLQK